MISSSSLSFIYSYIDSYGNACFWMSPSYDLPIKVSCYTIAFLTRVFFSQWEYRWTDFFRILLSTSSFCSSISNSSIYNEERSYVSLVSNYLFVPPVPFHELCPSQEEKHGIVYSCIELYTPVILVGDLQPYRKGNTAVYRDVTVIYRGP